MTMASSMKRAGTLFASVLLVAACTSTAQPPPETSASPQEAMAPEEVPESSSSGAAVGEAPECVDDKDQRVQCLADTDCCAGFVCGKDPELSHHVSYCIYGG